MRQLGHAKLDLHVTSVRNPLGILHGFPCIREKSLHLLFTLHIVLTAHVTHSVFICQLLAGLEAKQDIVWLYILLIGIMHIIGRYQGNIQLLTHL